MKMSTPFGRHPFRFERVEFEHGELAVTGTVAGLPAGVVFERRDLAVAAGLVAVGMLVAVRRGRAR
jgi:hypothetical protein